MSNKKDTERLTNVTDKGIKINHTTFSHGIKLPFMGGLRKLVEYEDICDSPRKLVEIDKLYLEKCVEVNKLKSELEKTMQPDIEICSFEMVDYKELYLEKCQEVNNIKAELDKYRWIPVSDRLPEEAFGCLVTIMDCNPMTGSDFENILPYHVGYDGDSWNDIDGEVIPFEVIAWMQLPEPYKEDKV